MSTGDWIIRTTTEEFRAPDLATIRQWCKDKRIPPDAMLYAPGASGGTRADRLPETRSIFTKRKVRLSVKFWPVLLTEVDAKAAAKQGVWATLIGSAITVLFILFGNGILGIDAWSLVDVGLMLFLAFGTWRMWRWAAVAALIVFVIGKVSLLAGIVELIKTSTLFVFFLFLMMYINAVRGTFAYRQFSKRQRQGMPVVASGSA